MSTNYRITLNGKVSYPFARNGTTYQGNLVVGGNIYYKNTSASTMLLFHTNAIMRDNSPFLIGGLDPLRTQSPRLFLNISQYGPGAVDPTTLTPANTYINLPYDSNITGFYVVAWAGGGGGGGGGYHSSSGTGGRGGGGGASGSCLGVYHHLTGSGGGTLQYKVGLGGGGGKRAGTGADTTLSEYGWTGGTGQPTGVIIEGNTYFAKGAYGGQGGGDGVNGAGGLTAGIAGSGVPDKLNINLVKEGGVGSASTSVNGGAGGAYNTFTLATTAYTGLSFTASGGGPGGSGDIVSDGGGFIGSNGMHGQLFIFAYYDGVSR